MAQLHPHTITRSSGAQARRLLGRGAVRALDILMPPQCLGCGASIERHGGICGACWSELSFIAGSQCETCGTPFELARGTQAKCAECIRARPSYNRARAALRYDDPTRRLILAFKRADRLEIAPLLATWMRQGGREVLMDAELLIPVPLHRWRLFQRRYNQAALLANALAKQCGLRALPEGLVRTRATPTQTGRSRDGRRRNVQGAFAIGKRCRDVICDRHIVVVDDVMTTGATVSACARCLTEAGARRVDVLTVARVIRNDSDGG